MRISIYISTLLLAMAAILSTPSCGKSSSKVGSTLSSQSDSLSYVVGLNIGYNILKMDSTLLADAIVAGINDALRGKESMSLEESRNYFLGYMNHGIYERVRNYEEQYLTDLRKSDKDIMLTKSGIAYKVLDLGNMSKSITSDRDTVMFKYHASRLSGEEVDPVAEREESSRLAVSRLIQGLKEGVKIVGEGGKVTLWIPSRHAYGAEGKEDLGINPNEMLRYEIEVLEVKRR